LNIFFPNTHPFYHRLACPAMVHEIKKQKASRILRFGVLGFFLSAAFFIPLTAFAQFTVDSNTPEIFGIMNATDLVSTIISVVQWILAITGLIAVIVMMYGGFVWMTARGDAEKIKKAKKILMNAVIGLVIILFAWVIVYFIVGFVSDTASGETGCNIGSYVDCQECVDDGSGVGEWVVNYSVPTCPELPTPQYQVRWTRPTDTQTNVKLCEAVQAGFDGITPPWLNASSVTADSVRITDESGTNIGLDSGFAVAENSNAFGYRHNTELLPNETYTVEINSITSTDKVQSQVGSVEADAYTWTFETGTESDENPPIVSNWAPQGSAVCLSPQIQVQFNEPMYAPSISNSNITISPLSPSDLTITGIFMNSASSFTATLNKPLDANTTYTITLSAVAPDGFQDSCGNLLDCGNGTNSCDANGTATGFADDNFSWTFTTEDTTETDCKPEITSITPTGYYSYNGGADSITIAGKNLGILADTVNFTNKFWNFKVDATDTTGVASRCFNGVALPNTAGAVSCIQNWTDIQIRTLVPAGGITLASLGSGATGGNVTVRTGGVITSDANTDFVDENSPHIKRLYPTLGGVGQFVTISGENFTNTPHAVYLRKGDYEVEAQTCDVSAWGDTQIVIEIPEDSNFVVGGEILVQVDVDPSAANDGRDRSNLQKFILTNDPLTPGLCTVNPICHMNAPNMVTVTGKYLSGVTVGYYQAQGEHTPTIYNSSSVSGVTDTSAQVTSSGTLPNDTFKLSVDGPNGVSNALDYQVPCTSGAKLLYENQCNLSAIPQVFPSPNPYPDSQNVCINLNRISFRFSEPIIPGGVGNYEIRACTNGKSDCETAYSPFSFGSVLGDPFGTTSVALATFGGSFAANTWYRVTVRGDIQNLSGVKLGEDEVWYFKTRDDATPCAADQLALLASDADGVAPMYVDATSTTSYPNTVLYEGDTVTNNCQSVNVPGSYAWTSSDATIAQCTTGTCGTADTQRVDAKQKDGTTNIKAVIGGLSATRQLHVRLDYCQKDGDCTTTIDVGGVPTTCTSTCNVAEERCDPHTLSLTPANGPESTITTLRGCYYGPTTGKVFFDTTEASYICGPSTWNTNGTEIKVAVPSGFAPGDVPQVTAQTAAGLISNALPFTINGLCSNGQPLPSTGVPPGLCSISPVSGIEQSSVTLRGEGLPDGANAQDAIEFTGAVALGADTTWTSATEVSTKVPANAQTGNVIVNATSTSGNACPSNPVSFTVTCNGNTQCGTGCCQDHKCVASGLCATGDVGEACKIDITPAHPSESCLYGETISTDPENYTCLADTGFTAAKDPPPPELGQQCQFCCDPDPNNDKDLVDAQTSKSGLVCTAVPAGGGTCESAVDAGAVRGLYCGCTSDDQCGGNTACSTKNDPTGKWCCRVRPGEPTIETASPMQCTNSAIVLNFDQPMDASSINSSTLIFTQLMPAPTHAIPGAYVVNGGKVTFYPSERLAKGATIEIRVTTNVKNTYGISPSAVYTNIVTVDPGAQLCKISSVKFTWSTSIKLGIAPPGLFTCARPDGCPGDTDTSPGNGNQNDYFATAVDSTGNPLSGAIQYHWEEKDATDVYGVDPACPNDALTPFACALTSHSRNGTGSIRVTASDADPVDDFEYGSAVAESRVTTFLCERPWPYPYTNAFPYEDSTYNGAQSPAWDFNFSLFYCRSEGNLPDLHIGTIQGGITAPLVDSFSPSVPNIDELLRQYAFFVTDSSGNRVGSDTIGIRVMENELNLPPDLWYKRAVGEDPHGQSTTVDGFPALRVGRSTYVTIANVSGAGMYPDMFIISYSDNATGETVSIYNQLIKNIHFTTNSAYEELSQIRNDAKRVQDLHRTSLSIADYKKIHGEYPSLSAGSYIEGFSVSTWPSWLETLGATLKITTPIDPVNKINQCPLAYQKVAGNESQFANQLPSGIAQDSSGRIYVVNYGGTTKTLSLCSANVQNCSTVWTFDATVDFPTTVTVDKSNGDVLVAVGGTAARVDRFNPNDFSSRKATYPIPSASGIETDKAGNLYVTRINADNGIYKYDSDGGLIASYDTSAGSCVTGGPCPMGMYVDDAAQEVYSVDKINNSVKVYDLDLTTIKRSFVGISSPVGVSVKGDSVFVTEHLPARAEGNRVYEIDKALTTIKHITQNPSIKNPYSIIAKDSGFIFANYANGSVEEYSLNMSSEKTCWNEQTRLFNAPSGSRIYSYKYNAGNPALYTNLEYHGAGNWINIPEDTNLCSGGNSCATFNFQWGAGAFEPWSVLYQSSGVPDTIPPTINTFSVPTPLTGTTTLTVGATDGGSGIDRALFFIDGKLKYTTTGPSLEWIFNPSSYLDGTYIFKVRVFDKAGNFMDSGDQSVQIEKAVNDQRPPALSNFTFAPASGNVVNANTTFRVIASDDQANDTGIAKVEYYLGTTFIGSCMAGDACASDSYAFTWDSTTVEDGDYSVYAVAFDNAGNTAFVKRDLTTDNGVDTQLPSVFILQPLAGQVSGVIQVIAQAVDNQGIQNVLLEMSVDDGDTFETLASSPSFSNPDTTSPYSWAWNTYFDPSNEIIDNGTTVILRVTATDVNGLTRSTTRDVVVNNTGASRPTAWFITPLDGDIYKPGLFEVFATDPVGVDRVDVYAYTGADLVNPDARHLIGTVSGGNPYQFSWDATLPDGVYGLRTIAYNANNIASDATAPGASIVVTIDTTSPSITSFTPADGGTFSKTITFSVGSTDLNGIKQSGVFVYAPGLFRGYVGSDCVPASPSSPYTCTISWNTLLNPAVPDGAYWFVGYAIDAAGNVGSRAYYNQTIDNAVAPPDPTPDVTAPSDPTITFTPELTNGWAKGTETITASSSDVESGIQFVDIYIDAALQDDNADGHTCTSSPCAWVWDTTAAAAGAHTVSAGAVDNAGNPSNTITLSAPVDNAALMVALQAPANNVYVSGTITVKAQSIDGVVPPASGVQKVTFYHTDPNNPDYIISEDTSDPYSISWDTTAVADGDYQIYGVMTDVAGNRIVSASRTTRVYNANPSLICGLTLCGGSAPSCCKSTTCYNPSVYKCCCSGLKPIGEECTSCPDW
jgi:hypothetical protein